MVKITVKRWDRLRLSIMCAFLTEPNHHIAWSKRGFRSVECKSFNVKLEMSRPRYIYFKTNFKMLCLQVILVSVDLDTKFRCLCAREVKDIRQVNDLRRISTTFILGTALLKFGTPNNRGHGPLAASRTQ